MADVWIARQSGRFGFTRYVALKTIRSEHAANESVRSMFLDEARLAARVRHVNVVDVLVPDSALFAGRRRCGA